MTSAVRCLEINQGCYNRCLTSHSARYWRFKQCWARSQLVVALDPSSVIASQGLLSTQWLLGNVVQADMQLPNLPYSIVLSPAKTWKTYYPASSWMSNWECGKELVNHGNQMFPLGIQGVLLSISEWSCKAGFIGSRSEFAGLLDKLCETYSICLFYQKSYWFVRPQLSMFMDIWSLSR